MSFTSDVRDELSHVEPECSHCEKATLAALVRIEGTLFLSGPGKYRVEIATDSASVGRLIIRLLHSIYDLKTQLTARRSILHKTPNYLIEIPALHEKVTYDCYEFEVLEMDNRRILKVKFTINVPAAPNASSL